MGKGKKGVSKSTKTRPDLTNELRHSIGASVSDHVDEHSALNHRAIYGVDGSRTMSDESVDGDSEWSEVFDYDIKANLDSMTCEKRAHLFSNWINSFTPKDNQALHASAKVINDMMAQIGKKFKDAETRFRENKGAEETIVLRSLEAVIIFHTNASLDCKLTRTEAHVCLLEDKLASRNDIIKSLISLNKTYQKKVQELMFISTAKSFYLLESALIGQRSESSEIATLKVNCELQTHKVELLEEALSVIANMNCMAHKELGNLDDHIHIMESPKCHGKNCLPNKLKHDSVHWHDFNVEIDEKKRATLKAVKNTVQSQVNYQILKGTQDWALLELLFDYVSRSDCKALVGYCRQVYGSAIEAIPQRSKSGPKLPSFRVYLSKIKAQTSAQIRREVQDKKKLEDFYLNAKLNNYLPPMEDDSACENEPQWTTSDELEMFQDSVDLLEDANNKLREKLAEAEKLSDTMFTEAKGWRDNHDIHMRNCKKQIVREDPAVTGLYEWIDEIVLKFSDDKNQSLKSKLAVIIGGINITIKERDAAIRKNEPLSKKLLQKDKTLDEKAIEFTRTVEGHRAHEDDLKQKISRLESTIAEKDAEIHKNGKLVDKVKEDWQKKLQRGFDKISVLEKKAKELQDVHDINKLDLEVTQNQLETARTNADAYRKKLEEQTSQLKQMTLERDENRSAMLSLRTNERVENDKIQKAVRDAEARKDAVILDLQGAIKILNKDRLADEKNIRGLSRWKDENDLKDQKITNYRMLALNATENENLMASALQEEQAKVANLNLLLSHRF